MNDVPNVKMPKMNANILRFLRWIFLKVCTVQDKGYTFPILFFKGFYRRNFLNVTKYNFLTIKNIYSILFLENKELKGSSWYLHLCKFKKKFTERKLEKLREKEGKYKKSLIYFLTRYCHGNDLQKVNNNARMLLILLENFVNISHRRKN